MAQECAVLKCPRFHGNYTICPGVVALNSGSTFDNAVYARLHQAKKCLPNHLDNSRRLSGQELQLQHTSESQTVPSCTSHCSVYAWSDCPLNDHVPNLKFFNITWINEI